MLTKIRKRDGREVPFSLEKIANAIFRAAQAVGGSDYKEALALAQEVSVRLSKEHSDDGEIPSVEAIQDTVEWVLVKHGHVRTAKEYILYRAERTKVREMNTHLMKTFEDLTFRSALESDIKRENANIDGDTAMGTMLKYGSEGAKQFYDLYVLDPAHAKAHKEGDIHIHDLDFYGLTTTCCQIDLIKLFDGGFATGQSQNIREPKDIMSYAALACIAIQANQNDQHGGQSIPNFEYAMAIGVRKTYVRHLTRNIAKALDMADVTYNGKDGEEAAAALLAHIEETCGVHPVMAEAEAMKDALARELTVLLGESGTREAAVIDKYTRKEIDRSTHQAMEALIHNLNTMHSRAGAQIPFSSLNYGTDISPEGRLVIRALLDATNAGMGNGETPIFPIQIFKVKEGINYNPGDPNYDLFQQACKVSAKRLFPNFSFLDAPYNAQYYKPGKPETEVAYMGCRTRVIANINKDKEIVNGRGNLSFSSVNLPRIAINAKGDVDWFFEELERKVDLVIDQLLERFRVQAARRVRNYPFLMGEGVWLDSEKLGKDDFVGEVLKHGTLTVGFIGLAECLKALTGFHHGENPDSQRLGLEIIGFMRKKMDKATEQYGMNFSLIGTPAEGLSGRFVRIDKQKYGIIPGITDREYYTNSFHVPVYYDISAYDKIRLEAPYHELTNGGHITYIELDGDPLENLDAFEDIVRCMKESGIGYGAINHPVDHDPACGYTGIIGNTCPGCGRDESGEAPFERIRRITGYLVGTLDHFNDAKRAEERDRVKHAVRSEMEMI